MTQTYLQPDDDIRCVCDDCGEETMSQDLDMVTDLEERVSPGFICPAGQCPHCGALAYYADAAAPDYSAQCELRKLREAKATAIAELKSILEGSEATGRWLDDTGSECAEEDEGAIWHEYTEEEQNAWLSSVADNARSLLAKLEA